MTQEQLAMKIPCSWSYVTKVERGVANPSAKARVAFAAALDTDPRNEDAAAELLDAYLERANTAARLAQVSPT